jgi:MSHA biogenesis protein MshL
MNYIATTRVSVSIVICAILLGCSVTEKSHVEDYLATEINAQREAQAIAQTQGQLTQLPDSVSDMLMSEPASSGEQATLQAEKYDINASGISAPSFFAGLVQDTPFSVAIHPEVTGSITLDLKQVTLDQVFSLLTDIYGFHIQKLDTVYRVFPAGMRTETFAVNYLMMQRDGSTQTSIISGGVAQGGNNNSGGGNQQLNNFSGSAIGASGNGGANNNRSGNGTTISTRSESNFWENLQESLVTMLGNSEGRSVLVSPQAGLVSVRALPDELKKIRNFLKISEQSLTRQVIIEARILEVELKEEYQQGIDWTQIVTSIGSTDLTFMSSGAVLGNAISSAVGGVASLGFANADFSGVLNLLSTQGNIQVLSSPRVTAINNQKAVIKVGEDEYFVTDISSQSTFTAGGTSVVPDIELTPFFSGIALDVTPQIDANGSILLHIHPSVIETAEQEKVVTLNEEQIVLPLAQSTIRESDTIIRANSGEIVVIGGLMQSVKSIEESKTPLLGDIPWFGNAFKSKREREIKKELIILLKPTVVEANTWNQQLENSRSQMADWLYVE